MACKPPASLSTQTPVSTPPKSCSLIFLSSRSMSLRNVLFNCVLHLCTKYFVWSWCNDKQVLTLLRVILPLSQRGLHVCALDTSQSNSSRAFRQSFSQSVWCKYLSVYFNCCRVSVYDVIPSRHSFVRCAQWDDLCDPWSTNKVAQCCTDDDIMCKCNLWGSNCKCVSRLWGR